eukprot:365693-Chlamydomonas_euryale.AAC.1
MAPLLRPGARGCLEPLGRLQREHRQPSVHQRRGVCARPPVHSLPSVVQYVQDVLFGCTRQNAIRTVQPVQNGGLYGVIIKASIKTSKDLVNLKGDTC